MADTPEMARALRHVVESQEPAHTIEQRESLIKWLDHIQHTAMHLIYAVGPDSIWSPENDMFVLRLAGVNDPDMIGLPRGAYLYFLHDEFDPKHKNPLACAVAHLCKAPDEIFKVPLAIAVALPKPTAHERIAAKMFIRKLVKENEQDEEIVSWASQLK